MARPACQACLLWRLTCTLLLPLPTAQHRRLRLDLLPPSRPHLLQPARLPETLHSSTPSALSPILSVMNCSSHVFEKCPPASRPADSFRERLFQRTEFWRAVLLEVRRQTRLCFLPTSTLTFSLTACLKRRREERRRMGDKALTLQTPPLLSPALSTPPQPYSPPADHAPHPRLHCPPNALLDRDRLHGRLRLDSELTPGLPCELPFCLARVPPNRTLTLLLSLTTQRSTGINRLSFRR